MQVAKSLVESSLAENMFYAETKGEKKAKDVAHKLCDLEANKGHDKQFTPEDCKAMGLKIEILEDDQALQEVVLSVHHAYEHSMALNPAVVKITENYKGKALVRTAAPMVIN